MTTEADEHTDFHGYLRSLEDRYDIGESERARELGRTVAELRD